MDTSSSAPRPPSPLSDLTSPLYKRKHTFKHICTLRHTHTHLGLMPLFQHNGLHDILFPKNHSRVRFYPKLSNLILSYPALLSRQGSVLKQWLNLPPESGFEGTKMEEAFPLLALVASVTHQPPHAPPPLHTRTHTHTLRCPNASPWGTLPSYLRSVFVPLSFLWGLH